MNSKYRIKRTNNLNYWFVLRYYYIMLINVLFIKFLKGGNDIEIKKINNTDIQYPNLLSTIYNSPQKLYVLGNIENLRRKCVSIVGCRKCSDYGETKAKQIAYKIAKDNYVIVSGLAQGIDTSAHIGAIQAKGRTIAVLAHGLNMIYPAENKQLAKQIIQNGGTLISEYSIEDKFKRENFILRNRIISGLSIATIVVEAKEKSGSLVTANYALEQGREVYAVPGNIWNENSFGTNNLIKAGAKIFATL